MATSKTLRILYVCGDDCLRQKNRSDRTFALNAGCRRCRGIEFTEKLNKKPADCTNHIFTQFRSYERYAICGPTNQQFESAIRK